MRDVRRLTDEGTQEFEAYLDALRILRSENANETIQAPLHLLEETVYSEPISCHVQIEDRTFGSRFEMGQYLVECFKDCDQRTIANDAGLWNWLALCYFDQLCKTPGKISENAHYTLSKHYGKRPRHSVRTTYILVRSYGSNVKFLFSKPDERGELIEQIAATQYLWSCKGVIEAASKLYQDDTHNSFKSGAGGSGKGSARRLKTLLSQLTLTYDLANLEADEILNLLPTEYERFKIPPKAEAETA